MKTKKYAPLVTNQCLNYSGYGKLPYLRADQSKHKSQRIWIEAHKSGGVRFETPSQWDRDEITYSLTIAETEELYALLGKILGK